ncbi:uncharacterized protein LOC144770791 [Lissotriton helveticus]
MEEGKHAQVFGKVALAGMLVAVLLAQGNALSCQQCVGSTSSSCTGPTLPCPSAGDQCISTLTETIITEAAQVTLFLRTCGASSECNQVASLSNPSMSVKISSTCCVADNCTPPQPILPPSKMTKTNVTCHSCLDISSTSCYSKDTIKCTGDETKCIRYSVKTTSGSLNSEVAARGCATPSFCAFQSTSESAGDTTVVTELACTDGSIHLQESAILLAFSGLLVLRLSF